MSVTTSADEYRDEAKEHVDKAIRCLSNILVDECWGHDEYHTEYTEKLNSAFDKLREVKRSL